MARMIVVVKDRSVAVKLLCCRIKKKKSLARDPRCNEREQEQGCLLLP